MARPEPKQHFNAASQPQLLQVMRAHRNSQRWLDYSASGEGVVCGHDQASEQEGLLPREN